MDELGTRLKSKGVSWYALKGNLPSTAENKRGEMTREIRKEIVVGNFRPLVKYVCFSLSTQLEWRRIEQQTSRLTMVLSREKNLSKSPKLNLLGLCNVTNCYSDLPLPPSPRFFVQPYLLSVVH